MTECKPKPQPKKGCAPPCPEVRNMFSERNHPGVRITEKSQTKQSFKDECDINNILARYQKTGAIDHFTNNEPQYGEILPVDFTEAMQIVARANEMFMELPSSLRQKFENKPEMFMDFVQNPDNADEMIELGLRDRSINDPPSSQFTASQPPSVDPVPQESESESGSPET